MIYEKTRLWVQTLTLNTARITISLAILAFLLLILTLCLTTPSSAQAVGFGVHILNTEELDKAIELLTPEEKKSNKTTSQPTETNNILGYVTIPFTLDETELDDYERWQKFFKICQKNNIVPLVRMTSNYDAESDSWRVPNRAELVTMLDFLNSLDWPQPTKHLIVFNEVNHAKEWGDKINPESYVEVLRFTSAWAKTSDNNFFILPAALDLAASNGNETCEAFNFLNKMLAYDPDFLTYIDAWNSHSYPNPNFSSAPTKTGQNSLRGFEYELRWLAKNNPERDWQVFITETGWQDNASTGHRLDDYYNYAYRNIWSNSQVVAVTPFLLQGDPGPYTAFSFIKSNGEATRQYDAFQNILLLAQENLSNLRNNLPSF